MLKQVFALVIVVVAGLGVSACGDDSEDPRARSELSTAAQPGDSESQAGADDEAPEDPPEPEQVKPEKPGLEITTADSQFGEILFDVDRRAIYYFDLEDSDRSQCYDDCATAWPPVLTKGDPVAAGGAKDSLLGTTKRDDGKVQVTYDGHPLYYYVDDPPGEILCHNVFEFGGLWLAVQPGGEAVS